MNENKWKKRLLTFLNNFEVYIGTVIFLALTVLLFIQVITRYVFGRAFTWSEEVGVVMFVWLIYLGAAAAARTRQHLRIDAVLNIMPFKVKRVVLILTNVAAMFFCAYTIPPIVSVVTDLANSHAKNPITGIPKAFSYVIIPICLALMIIRFLQDTIQLAKEDEERLGAGKKMIDLGDGD